MDQVPVRARITGETTISSYTPRYQGLEGVAASDVNIFAISPAACSRYLDAADEEVVRRPQTNLIFASAFDVESTQNISSRLARNPFIAFPLISSEYCPGDGLNIATDMGVEVLSPRESVSGDQLPLRLILDHMGMDVSAYVGLGRFRARYLQTAAVYVVLLALNVGLITHADADAALMLSVLREFLDMIEGTALGLALDFPAPPEASFAAVASLIALSRRHSDEILLRNLHYLLSSGKRKLACHLTPLKTMWARHASSLSLSKTPGRNILTSVFSTC